MCHFPELNLPSSRASSILLSCAASNPFLCPSAFEMCFNMQECMTRTPRQGKKLCACGLQVVLEVLESNVKRGSAVYERGHVRSPDLMGCWIAAAAVLCLGCISRPRGCFRTLVTQVLVPFPLPCSW